MTEIRIYFEGHRALRPGFGTFFRELRDSARNERWRFELIAGGSAYSTVQDFKTALESHRRAWNILLLDSDGRHTGSLFEGLRRRAGLPRGTKDSVFWMVQVMESWFLADLEALDRFYGQGFRAQALRLNPEVETIPKADVTRKLALATRNTKKGAYHKTKHAPALLLRIRPERVRAACPNCDRIFRVVLNKLSC